MFQARQILAHSLFQKLKKLSFGNLRSPNSNPPFLFSQNFLAIFSGMEKGRKRRNELNLICNEFHETIKQIKPCNLETYKGEPTGTSMLVTNRWWQSLCRRFNQLHCHKHYLACNPKCLRQLSVTVCYQHKISTSNSITILPPQYKHHEESTTPF